jgi:hypothetical protein
VLATSLLDEQAYPTAWFRKLDQLCWGVEEEYKCEKLRLEIDNFSERTPLSLRREFHSQIVAQNLTAIFALLAQSLVDERYAHRKLDYRINFANALSKMKNNIITYPARYLTLGVVPQAAREDRQQYLGDSIGSDFPAPGTQAQGSWLLA